MCAAALNGFLEVAANEERNTNEAQRRGQIVQLNREKERKQDEEEEEVEKKM